MKTGLEKEMTKFQTSAINGYLAWMLAGVQTNHGGSSVHAQWFSHQNNGADYCEVTTFSCALEGGNYNMGSTTKLEEFGCCYYCCLGI